MEKIDTMIQDFHNLLSYYPPGYSFNRDELDQISKRCGDIINMIEISD